MLCLAWHWKLACIYSRVVSDSLVPEQLRSVNTCSVNASYSVELIDSYFYISQK